MRDILVWLLYGIAMQCIVMSVFLAAFLDVRLLLLFPGGFGIYAIAMHLDDPMGGPFG